MIFESHAHYDDDAFDEDRESLLGSLQQQGIEYVINVGASLASTARAISLAADYDFIYAAAGVHPSDTDELNEENFIWLKDQCKKDKVVAVGEIGLDYHYPDTNKPIQQKWFARQLWLANEVQLPVIIHSRDAAKDTLDIMKGEAPVEKGGVIHCYSYTKEVARDFLNMGYYFGIGGVLTFKNAKKLREAVEYIPMDRLLIETDSPYLAPEPYRGKRNCSLYLPYVVDALAEIKGLTPEEVIAITRENGLSLFMNP
ncbi:MAG: TatD family hydrolase [Lachnospiraceae bacterium]